MAFVAGEMERNEYFRDRKIPLLIGGATTSRVHTAVKIAPHYSGPVVYVPDASRSVPVAQALVSEEQRAGFLADLNSEYERVRNLHGKKKGPAFIPLADARANHEVTDWSTYVPPKPKFIGRRTFKNQDLAKLAEYIDWGPFFQTWDLAGKFPDILTDEIVGVEATKVYEDGKAMLKKIIDNRWLTANGVVMFLPASSIGDDIEIYTDETRSEVAMTWRNLRQQNAKREGIPNKSLADYIAPKFIDGKPSGIEDYIGIFAVTAGIGAEKKEAEFMAKLDDYNAIAFKSIADRLAEAFAEALHERVRKDLWGYASDEKFSNDELIAEAYTGIRRARLSVLPRAHHQARDVRADELRGNRHVRDRITGHDAGGQRVGLLFLASEVRIFRHRQHRRGPAAGLHPAQRPRRSRRAPGAGAVAGVSGPGSGLENGALRLCPIQILGRIVCFPEFPLFGLVSEYGNILTLAVHKRCVPFCAYPLQK